MDAIPIEVIAEKVHVPIKAMVDLLNTIDYVTMTVEDWCPLLQQPIEAVQAWPDHVKEYVFTELSLEVSALVTPEAARIDAVSEVNSNKLAARNDSVRRMERQALALHDARIKSGRSGCFQNWACGSCVVAAGLAGASGIAGCTGAALAAIEGTAGFALADVYAAYFECTAKVGGATTAAIGVCHSGL
ncbi:hypothetical protein BKA58DRAFT_458596 [Alternaria rosae]|uniref:uncharacterized protein n=1 Tax=Alternaria rosae TaxID=1187941 RepID=UPI001E8D46D5|nr:uncharacterized protein BKA58DRAFT_458596 [Alternaria rosae]KAH6867987.1 hypothetical protein BKA58DRAFT_458596 [Alternaria rosae]